MNEADRQVYVSQVRRILSSEMLSERIVTLFEMEMDECRADAKRNIQQIEDSIEVIYEREDEIKRLRMYEVAWKILYDNAREEERETRTRTWKEIMELVRSDVREMFDESHTWDEWLDVSIGGFE